MKLSLNLQDNHHHKSKRTSTNHHHIPTAAAAAAPLLLRVKLPITILNLPFLSSFATSSPSPSFSLRTNFPTGPTLKLTYTPPTTTTAAAVYAGATSPFFTLTLSSGIGPCGSPSSPSPLTISAQFSHPHKAPTFYLHFKPRLGDFSLRKIFLSNPNKNQDPISPDMGFVPIEKPISRNEPISSISGVCMVANTAFSVNKRVNVRLRWGVNFPSDARKGFLPFLSVDKIGIERIDEAKETNVGDFQALKGKCESVERGLEALRNENVEMRRCLDEMRFFKLVKPESGSGLGSGYSEGVQKVVGTVLPVNEGFRDFEKRKPNNSGVKDNVYSKESKNESNKRGNDLESELQRAIKAASSK